jgi:hypothetical protein
MDRRGRTIDRPHLGLAQLHRPLSEFCFDGSDNPTVRGIIRVLVCTWDTHQHYRHAKFALCHTLRPHEVICRCAIKQKGRRERIVFANLSSASAGK